MTRLSSIVILVIVSLTAGAQRYSEEDMKETAIFLQANQKKLLGKYDEAIELYNTILENDPLNATIHHDLARIYLAQENFEEAKKAIEKAIKYEGDQSWFQLTFVEISEIIGDHKEAADGLEVIARIFKEEGLYHRWAENLVKANQELEAIAVYNEAQSTFGSAEWYTERRIDLYLSVDDKKSAEKEIKELVKSHPGNLHFVLKQGEFYMRVNDLREAKKSFEKALEMDPDNEMAIISLAAIQNSSSNKGGSELSQLITDGRVGIDPKIQALIPFVEDLVLGRDESRTEEILRLTEYLMTNYPEEAKVHSIRGDVLTHTGNIDGAIEAYFETLRYNKSVYGVWQQLMASLLYKKDMDRLEDVASEAIDYYPNQSGPYYYLAWTALENSNLVEAENLLEEALFMATGDEMRLAEISVLSANTKLASKDIEGALDILDQFLASYDDGHPEVYEFKGDLHLQLGEKEAAQENWKKALRFGGDKERINAKIQSI